MGSKSHSLIGWVVSFLAVCLGIAVYAFGVWNTWGLLSLLMPGDWLRPALGVALFDCGMVVWFGVFVYHSRGLGQRGIALLAGVLSLVGMLLSNWYFLTLGSGQTLVKIGPEDGLWALRIVEAGIIVGVCSGVLHYLLNPEIVERMRQQAREDKVMDQAATMADRKVDDVAAEVADQIGDDMRESALRKLAALNSRRTLTVQGRVIESGETRPALQAAATFASDARGMPRFAVGAPPAREGDDVVRAHLSEYQSMMRDKCFTPEEARKFIHRKYAEVPGGKNTIVRSEIVGDVEYLWYADGSTGVRGVGGKPLASATVTIGEGDDAEKA